MDGRCIISYWFDFTIGCSSILLIKSINFFLKKKKKKKEQIALSSVLWGSKSATRQLGRLSPPDSKRIVHF